MKDQIDALAVSHFPLLDSVNEGARLKSGLLWMCTVLVMLCASLRHRALAALKHVEKQKEVDVPVNVYDCSILSSC